MIQSVQTTINNCIWVEAFLIMYAKSTTLTKQNSVSVTGSKRRQSTTRKLRKRDVFLRRESSEIQWFANSTNPKQDLSMWSLQEHLRFVGKSSEIFDVDPFSQSNREAARWRGFAATFAVYAPFKPQLHHSLSNKLTVKRGFCQSAENSRKAAYNIKFY